MLSTVKVFAEPSIARSGTFIALPRGNMPEGSMKNRVLFQSSCGDLRPMYKSGVSLHGHTMHSVESLGFLGKFLEERSLLRSWVGVQRERGQRNTGIALDLHRAHWTPPLCERQAHELESRQIESLGLRAMVSLSDHDTIKACALLRQVPEFQETPVSTEWTVPFGNAIFHIGVHNLPSGIASLVLADLLDASKACLDSAVLDLLMGLSELPGVLLVFNHPLWNLNGVPPAMFERELIRFLRSANGHLHAFELNGMRSYRENRGVIKLAAEWDQLLISGGDRHGCEPNAALNLTNATDFSEFVDEIRNQKQSTILLMAQYQEHLSWRMYKSFTHVIDHYPENPEGRRSWDERIFHPDLNGEIVPLIGLWHLGPPGFLKEIFALAILGASLPIPAALTCWSRGPCEILRSPAGESTGQTGFQLRPPSSRLR